MSGNSDKSGYQSNFKSISSESSTFNQNNNNIDENRPEKFNKVVKATIEVMLLKFHIIYAQRIQTES